jgi:hypothetical protein
MKDLYNTLKEANDKGVLTEFGKSVFNRHGNHEKRCGRDDWAILRQKAQGNIVKSQPNGKELSYVIQTIKLP